MSKPRKYLCEDMSALGSSVGLWASGSLPQHDNPLARLSAFLGENTWHLRVLSKARDPGMSPV